MLLLLLEPELMPPICHLPAPQASLADSAPHALGQKQPPQKLARSWRRKQITPLQSKADVVSGPTVRRLQAYTFKQHLRAPSPPDSRAPGPPPASDQASAGARNNRHAQADDRSAKLPWGVAAARAPLAPSTLFRSWQLHKQHGSSHPSPPPPPRSATGPGGVQGCRPRPPHAQVGQHGPAARAPARAALRA